MDERPTRVLLAPDKFKGTLTAAEAAEAMRQGVLDALPEAAVSSLPFADGGEGTVDAAIAAGAQARTGRVTGPLGQPVDAQWAMLDDTAIIEMAQASGLALVTPSPQAARQAHTEGTGELIRLAVEDGARRIVLGVGGSASTDAGTGAMRTLGVVFRDADGAEVHGGGGQLHRIVDIDASAAISLLSDVQIVLCSDVANPFVGALGAAHVFGPQKGADAETVDLLDAGLRRFSDVVARVTGTDLAASDWGGSGGGVAGGFQAILRARAESGVEILSEVLHLDARIAASDLVIVGEGSLDPQSLLGKTPVGVARHARALEVPCIAVAGRLEVTLEQLREVGIADCESASRNAPDVEAALAQPARWVREATALVVSRALVAAAPAPSPPPLDPISH